MNNYTQYQSTDLSGTTRIEMLLKLYDAALGSIERAQHASTRNDADEYTTNLRQARRLTLGLLSGIDRGQAVGEQQYRLLIYVISCLNDDRLEPAAHVLSILQSAFQEIEDEAIALELRGEIPSMSEPVAMDCQA